MGVSKETWDQIHSHVPYFFQYELAGLIDRGRITDNFVTFIIVRIQVMTFQDPADDSCDRKVAKYSSATRSSTTNWNNSTNTA